MQNDIEIEVKAYADSLERVEEALAEKGAEFLEDVPQVDVYFGHPARDFRWSDEALRVRWAGDRTAITYKGPRLDKHTKTRKELEVGLEDADRMIALLQDLSFSPFCTVRKRRKTYRLGKYEICLDDVEGLGRFVEVETEGADVEGLKQGALDLLAELGLERTERLSYLELLMKEKDAD